jgi:hypothetical protein
MPLILAIWEAESRRITVRGQRRFMRPPHLQNDQSKVDWRCGSSGRTPALQVWSPEFKTKSYWKKKNQSNNNKKLKYIVTENVQSEIAKSD